MANERNFILQSFGLQNVKGLIYPPGKKLKSGSSDFSAATKQDIADLEYNMTTMETGTAPLSMLGTPVFADMILKSDEKGTEQLQLLWCLLGVNQTKNIVKTVVQGRKGTVKEYIADGDYMVTIRGGLVSPFSNAYPKEDVSTLLRLLKKNEPLFFISEYLSLFDIYNLVVEDYSFAQKEGAQNIQLFEIKTVSDDPIQFQLMEK